ncbi:MAG: S1 RNA-binding domain-containing protein [SAR202 cluster bacterium]|mgnify:FL=1|nr:S1 RNA-binding domain-containing protein [SAR202 cluster bacterium]MQG43301.1 S1 RNA-binding domain-containing protein [SAR202 cluster bacterium]
MTNKTEENGQAPDLMEELLSSNPPKKPLRRGEIIDGKIMEINDEGLLLNIGHKSEGIVPTREMRSFTKVDYDTLEEGSEVVALVINPEDDDGATILSVDKARGERGWRVLEKAKEEDKAVDGVIIGSNRGGAVVQAEDVQGFIPLSQLVGPARELFVPKKENAKDGFIGMKITFKIFELNRRRNRAIFSEKAVLQQERAQKKQELIETLQVGNILKGRIVGVSTFGAFVDIGGADGLIHISELSWDPVSSPADIVTVGTEMDVYVVKIDKENLKIALSLKRLTPEPWEIIKDELVVGRKIVAKVTKITTFGAFVRTEQGVEGLVHVSEISNQELGSVEDIESVINVGQSLDLTIVNVDTERKRLGLSLISSAKPEENDEVQVAAVSEDSETNIEENSDTTSVSNDEDSTNEEVTEEEKEV